MARTKKKPEVVEDTKKSALETIKKQMNSKYGKGAVDYLGNSKVLAIPRISSQSYLLDNALGGGYPEGRVVEIYGPESSGKSTVCYHAIASTQQENKNNLVALVDAENSWDNVYAENLGVNVEDVLINQPESGEQALDVLIDFMKMGVKLIVVDSVAALIPQAELDGGIGDQQMGLQARMMSKALRKINNQIGITKNLVLFTNQTRQKIGVVYGNPEVVSGGNALKFYASIRIKLNRSTVNTDKSGNKISNLVKASVVKNKCIAEGEVLFNPKDNQCYFIEELVGKENYGVYSFDGHNVKKAKAKECVKQTVDKCLKVNVKNVGGLKVNYKHPFLTPSGYVSADKLKKGDLVGVVSKLDFKIEENVLNKEQGLLLGILAGGGYVGGKTGVTLINCSTNIIDKFKNACASFDCDVYEKKDAKYKWVVRKKDTIKGKPNDLHMFLKNNKMWDKLALTKEIPPNIFISSNEVVSHFIGGVIATSGCVSINNNGKASVDVVLISKKFTEGLRVLLLRFGIIATVVERKPRLGDKINGRQIKEKNTIYQLRIRNQYDCIKLKKLAAWSDGKLDKIKTDNCKQVEQLPLVWINEIIDFCKNKNILLKHLTTKYNNWYSYLGVKRNTNTVNKQRVKELLKFLIEKGINELEIPFYQQINADIVWKSISSIEKTDDTLVYDVVGSDNENFVIQGLITHNTAPPFRECQFIIKFGRGIDNLQEILDLAIQKEIIQKSGSWFSMNGEQLGQGNDAVYNLLSENTKLFEKVKEQVFSDVAIATKETKTPPIVIENKDTTVEVEDGEV